MVMGIIGVVAAITIPNLNKNIGDQERVAKVQTMVADVDQAYKIALKNMMMNGLQILMVHEF